MAIQYLYHHTMLCPVTRTYYRGEKRHDRDSGPTDRTLHNF